MKHRFAARSFLLALALAAFCCRPAGAQDLFVINYGVPETTALRYDGTTGTPKPSNNNAGADFTLFKQTPGDVHPSSIAFGPDRNLYVTDIDNFRVLRYNGQTGAFVDIFTPSNSRLNYAQALTFGPDKNLYVASSAITGTTSFYNGIFRYDGTTGASLPSGTNQGALFIPGLNPNNPDQTILPSLLAFAPDGSLYVMDDRPRFLNQGPQRIVRYDGKTGAYLGAFSAPVSDIAALAFGPDQQLYIGSWEAGVQRYDSAAQTWSLFANPNPESYPTNPVTYSLAFGPDSKRT